MSRLPSQPKASAKVPSRDIRKAGKEKQAARIAALEAELQRVQVLDLVPRAAAISAASSAASHAALRSNATAEEALRVATAVHSALASLASPAFACTAARSAEDVVANSSLTLVTSGAASTDSSCHYDIFDAEDVLWHHPSGDAAAGSRRSSNVAAGAATTLPVQIKPALSGCFDFNSQHLAQSEELFDDTVSSCGLTAAAARDELASLDVHQPEHHPSQVGQVVDTDTAEQNEPSLATCSGSTGEGTSLTTPGGRFSFTSTPGSSSPGAQNGAVERFSYNGKVQNTTAFVGVCTAELQCGHDATVSHSRTGITQCGPLQSYDANVITGGMHDADFSSQHLANTDGPLQLCASAEQPTEQATPVHFGAIAEMLAVGSDDHSRRPLAQSAAPVSSLAQCGASTELSVEHGRSLSDFNFPDLANTCCMKDVMPVSFDTGLSRLAVSTTSCEQFPATASPRAFDADLNSQHLANLAEHLPPCDSAEQPTVQATPVLFGANAEMLAVGGGRPSSQPVEHSGNVHDFDSPDLENT